MTTKLQRRTFLQQSALAVGGLTILSQSSQSNAAEAISQTESSDIALNDLHVHTTGRFTIQDAVQISKQRKIKFGIVEHPGGIGGGGFAIQDDEGMKRYAKELRKYDVFVGLQPIYRNWSKSFSAEALAQLDYVLMDPQTIPQEDGSFLLIWQLEARVDNTDKFMAQYMEHSLQILHNEPIQIFGWPLFLPVCIARDYYKLWTDERKQQIITAAKAKNIAIEINEMAHVPDEEFIKEAKNQGLKFTFGSDARNQNAGNLVYCRDIAQRCNLQAQDFFVPTQK